MATKAVRDLYIRGREGIQQGQRVSCVRIVVVSDVAVAAVAVVGRRRRKTTFLFFRPLLFC